MNNRTPAAAEPAPAGHPIAVVAERTGLSRDVLRVWERRYAAVAPARSAGGQRLYSDEQVARFRLLAAATGHGRSISQVAGLTDDELARMVADDELARPARPNHDGARAETLDHAMALTEALDGSGLSRTLRRAIARHGFPFFLEEIVPALMQRVGDEWHASRLTIAHEHLASAAVLAIILEGLHVIPETPGAPRLVVATPSGAQHALGAALAAVAAALDGWTVVHLGADVPAADVATAAATTEAHAVAMSVVYAEDAGGTERELRAMRAALPARVPLIIGGAAVGAMAALKADAGVIACATIAELRAVLAREMVAA